MLGIAATMVATAIFGLVHLVQASFPFPPLGLAQRLLRLVPGPVAVFFIDLLGHWALRQDAVGFTVASILAGGAAAVLAARAGPTRRSRAAWLAGGLLGHVMQGSDTADQFVIRRTDGSTLQVATEQRDLEPGDCVAIEQGEQTNLRRVNAGSCQPGSLVTADSSVAVEEQHDAQVCHEANQSLNSAQGVRAIDAAIARVRALCHN